MQVHQNNHLLPEIFQEVQPENKRAHSFQCFWSWIVYIPSITWLVVYLPSCTVMFLFSYSCFTKRLLPCHPVTNSVTSFYFYEQVPFFYLSWICYWSISHEDPKIHLLRSRGPFTSPLSRPVPSTLGYKSTPQFLVHSCSLCILPFKVDIFQIFLEYLAPGFLLAFLFFSTSSNWLWSLLSRAHFTSWLF